MADEGPKGGIVILKIKSSRLDGKEPLDDGNVPVLGEDRRMMLSPQYWPKWPILPLIHKREQDSSGLSRTALLYDCSGDDGEDGPRFRFYVDGLLGLTEIAELEKAPKADIDQLLADGWLVD